MWEALRSEHGTHMADGGPSPTWHRAVPLTCDISHKLYDSAVGAAHDGPILRRRLACPVTLDFWDCPGFSTGSPMSQETPPFWKNWDGWSS